MMDKIKDWKMGWLILIAGALFLSGCATMIENAGGIGIRRNEGINLKASDFERAPVTYKLLYYNMGITRWTVVGSTPIKPNEKQLLFGKCFVEAVKKEFDAKGISLKEGEANETSNVFIEMRISTDARGSAGTRWFVNVSGKKAEIYYFVLLTWFGKKYIDDSVEESLKDAAERLSSKAIKDFLILINQGGQ